MAVTAALVKELRDKTGAGMMDCKKALSETDGNLEEAVDWLRTKGLAAWNIWNDFRFNPAAPSSSPSSVARSLAMPATSPRNAHITKSTALPWVMVVLSQISPSKRLREWMSTVKGGSSWLGLRSGL